LREKVQPGRSRFGGLTSEGQGSAIPAGKSPTLLELEIVGSYQLHTRMLASMAAHSGVLIRNASSCPQFETHPYQHHYLFSKSKRSKSPGSSRFLWKALSKLLVSTAREGVLVFRINEHIDCHESTRRQPGPQRALSLIRGGS
jgi:hypothetical protein